jgi:tetratricopeptide (TPR) repeat protein
MAAARQFSGVDTERAVRRALFQQQITAGIQYWRKQLVACAGNLTALDVDNENVAGAIWLGLQSSQTSADALELAAEARVFVLRRGALEAWQGILDEAARVARAPAAHAPAVTVVGVLSLAARVCELRAALTEAEGYYRAALEWCAACETPQPACAGLLADFGRFLVYHGRGEEGVANLRQALDLSTQHGWTLAHTHALLGMGLHYNRIRDGQAALPYLAEALRLAEAERAANYRSLVLSELGTAHWHVGDLEQARICFEQALTWAAGAGDVALQAIVHNQLGIIHYEQDQFQSAVEQFLRAEAIHRRTGCALEERNLYNNLGAAYWGLRDWAAAERYFRLALAAWRASGDTLGATEVLINLAECYLDQENRGRAAFTLIEAGVAVAGRARQPGWVQLVERIVALEARLAAALVEAG